MKPFRLFIWSFLVLVFVPLAVGTAMFYGQGWPRSWSSADWSATGTAPDPAFDTEAIVLVYAARTGRWKGIFAVHTWIALKPKNPIAVSDKKRDLPRKQKQSDDPPTTFPIMFFFPNSVV